MDIENEMPDDYFYNHEAYMDLGLDPAYPFRSKRHIVSALRNVRTKRESRVRDECCSKPCTVEEMLGYCG